MNAGKKRMINDKISHFIKGFKDCNNKPFLNINLYIFLIHLFRSFDFISFIDKYFNDNIKNYFTQLIPSIIKILEVHSEYIVI